MPSLAETDSLQTVDVKQAESWMLIKTVTRLTVSFCL